MLIVCASLSAAPGVSTLAAGLAAGWPDGPALLLETDPSGGVFAARFQLAQEPGLTSLAAQMRHGDLVLDPFAGSGTLGAVAAATGRRYLLMDASADAVRVMRARLGG